MNEFRKFSTFIRSHIGEPVPEIKIVLLDSGIDPEHPYIKNRWNQGMRGSFFRDFVNEDSLSTQAYDNDGHGTHCAGIILQFAPDAVLYVARVVDTKASCRKDKMLKNKISKVSLKDKWDKVSILTAIQALTWAVDDLKADIVSMSFGLGSDDDTIRGQIAGATSHTTFVAAAANSGSRQAIAFPACEDHVICIQACNGNGKATDFTPSAQDNPFNFSILGVGILSTWPTTSNTLPDEADKSKFPGPWKYSSGTSVATPLAVALIANLKAYVDVNQSKLQGKLNSSRLNRLLSSMTVKTDRYDTLMPWRGSHGQFQRYTDPTWFYNTLKINLSSR
jgi:subtilisin family serine protease